MNRSVKLPSKRDTSQLHSPGATARWVGALPRVVCVAVALLHANTASAREMQGQPGSIQQGLADPAFAAAYKRSFEPYWGLRWVASPALELPARSVATGEGHAVRLYTACRPHACAREKLVFVYDPETRNGWGALRVRSDVEGSAATPPTVEQLVNEALEGRK